MVSDLIAGAGLGGQAADDVASALHLHDIYTRHHHEQMLGSDLEVRTGLVSADASGLCLYHELANASSGVLAATFQHRFASTRPLPEAVVNEAAPLIVPVPEQGATRSISLVTDRLATAPTLAELERRQLALREPRLVREDECDPDGAYRADMAPMLVWDGEPAEGRTREFVHTGPNGEEMGWATMENRVMINRLPRLGEEVQSFFAPLEVANKVTRSLHWAFATGSEELLISFEVVNLAFDIGARRAMVIPDNYRARELELLQPDLD